MNVPARLLYLGPVKTCQKYKYKIIKQLEIDASRSDESLSAPLDVRAHKPVT